jgi:hypothetical protein
MSKLYDFNQYDKYLSLKVNPELWLVILYLLRPYIALVASVSIGRGGTGAVGVERVRDILYPDNFSLVLAILTTVPALLFVYAWTRRKPGASPLVRKLWKNGAALLAIAALLNIVIVFVPLLTGIVAGIHTLGWLQVGFAAVIIVYLYSSRRVKDTLADFPADREE